MSYLFRHNLLKFALLIGASVFLFSSVTLADARTNYLINLLKTGSSYRVKMQAAQSLGRIRSKEAIPALTQALKDKSEQVVIASAAALVEIGDPSAISALKRAKKGKRSAAVKNQLATSIQILNSLGGTKVQIAMLSSPKHSFLVKVDAMGNSSKSKTKGIVDKLKNTVIKTLSKKEGVEIQSANLNTKQVKEKLKGKTKGFVLSGALVKLEVENGFMVANITMNVLTNPGYNLVMMPSGEARVPLGFVNSTTNEQMKKETIKKAEEQAIEKLVDNLIAKILEAAPNVL